MSTLGRRYLRMQARITLKQCLPKNGIRERRKLDPKNHPGNNIAFVLYCSQIVVASQIRVRGQPILTRTNSPWRIAIACVVIIAAAISVPLALNLGGWRARILARLTRADNWPVVVPTPPNFQPTVPPGFHVSLFAKGFLAPRWLAIAPNGDVFVADSGAGQIVVLHGLSEQGSAESRLIFADHLNLPFGIAFHSEYVYVANT